MLTKLVICLCVGTIIHAESIIATSTSTSTETAANLSLSEPTSSPALFVIEDELTKLATDCMTPEEHEELLGHKIRWRGALYFDTYLILQAASMIGLEELRAALGFGPRGNKTKYNESKGPRPSAEELEAAPTLEAYYQLREPSRDFGFDRDFFYEYNFPPAIALLDKRFPTIRKIFRHKFEEVFRGYESRNVDRKAVDELIGEFEDIRGRMYEKMEDLDIRTHRCLVAKEKPEQPNIFSILKFTRSKLLK